MISDTLFNYAILADYFLYNYVISKQVLKARSEHIKTQLKAELSGNFTCEQPVISLLSAD